MTENAEVPHLLSVDDSSQPIPPVEPYKLIIAGVWQRLFAGAIDLIILAIIFLIIGVVFRATFFRIGPNARLISFLIGFIYFGYFGSYLADGQSPGKRVMKIAVTDAQGHYLTLKKSHQRAAILSLIMALNGWNYPMTLIDSFWSFIAYAIFIIGAVTLVYGYLANKVTRQGPHDLLIGAYVVEKPSEYSDYIAPIRPRIHDAMPIVIAWFGILVFWLASTKNPMLDVYKALNKEDAFLGMQVSRNGDVLTVLGWYPENCQPEECDKLLWKLAEITLGNYDDIDQIKKLEVAIINRMDFGYGLSITIQPVNVRMPRSANASIDVWRIEIGDPIFQEALTYQQQENHSAAIAAYSRFIKIMPSFANAYKNRAIAYQNLGDFQAALDDFYHYRDLQGEETEPDVLSAIEGLEEFLGVNQ